MINVEKRHTPEHIWRKLQAFQKKATSEDTFGLKQVYIYFKLKRAVLCYSSRTTTSDLEQLQSTTSSITTTSTTAESTYTSSAAEDITMSG